MSGEGDFTGSHREVGGQPTYSVVEGTEGGIAWEGCRRSGVVEECQVSVTLEQTSVGISQQLPVPINHKYADN